MPAVSDETVSVVTPVASSVPVTMAVVPSRRVTVPLGMPVPDVTVAVKTTPCP